MGLGRRIPWAVILLAIVATGYVRIRLLQTPLERDEGEYAYTGQLILDGIPPYQLARSMKLPGTCAAYAVIMRVFGQTVGAIHFGLMLINAAATLLLFLLGRRLFGAPTGLAAGAAFAVLSVGQAVLGTQAHATHFVVLPALGGTLLLLRATDTGRSGPIIGSGALFGLAFFAKQHGAFFGILGALWLVWIYRRHVWRKLALFGAAAALPFGVTCLTLWGAGTFPQFWFWTISYARRYVQQGSIGDATAGLLHQIASQLRDNPGICLLALVGMLLVWHRKKSNGEAAFVTVGLLLSSFAATAPGFYFRDHYFVMVLPAVALLAGATVASGRTALAWLFAGGLALSFVCQRELMFRMTPFQVSRKLYVQRPFPEAIQVGAYIKDHTAEDARVLVLGSEPEIYFYAHRHSATGYIYMYPLTESQPYALTMQDEMIREVEAQRPEYVVFVHVRSSWLTDLEGAAPVLGWWKQHCARNYSLVGIVDMVSEDRTEYRWDAAVMGYWTRSDAYLQVYRRR